MLRRSGSKDHNNANTGSVYMSSRQMADYLCDLRSNRVPRPNGSRPLPSSAATGLKSASIPLGSKRPAPVTSSNAAAVPSQVPVTKSVQSSAEDNGVEPEPSATYREGGQRWMERQEAHSLRRALEDIDANAVECLHSAARHEASELILKHRNSQKPYDYREHLRKGSYRRSLSGQSSAKMNGGNALATDRTSISTGSRSSSGGTTDRRQNSIPTSSPTSSTVIVEVLGSTSLTDSGEDITAKDVPQSPCAEAFPMPPATQPRRSNGPERTVSNEAKKDARESPGSTVYEEPEEKPSTEAVTTGNDDVLRNVRRNPFARIRNLQDHHARSNSEPTVVTKKLDHIDIQKNPVSRTRNPLYTRNEPPATPPKSIPSPDEKRQQEEDSPRFKDGIEIRGEDIRAATTMKMKDRSPNLPAPAFVTDSPGRPIVSFEKAWRPKDIDHQRSPPSPTRSTEEAVIEREKVVKPPRPLQTSSLPVVPTISVFEAPRMPLNDIALPSRACADRRPQPTELTYSTEHSAIPQLNNNDRQVTIPIINFPDDPTVSATEAPEVTVTPTIQISTAPQISIDSAPTSRTIAFHKPFPTPARPLPAPTNAAERPLPRHSATAPASSSLHYTPSVRATVALCSQCALPISGRIVSAAGSRFHPQCFVCHHCGEGLECVAFYPEPEAKRAERIDRINARQNGEVLGGEDDEERRAQAEMEDGDGGMRFYCHLDFHEFFSPRCGSCKTPIEGEVVVACGKEWHVGHFFCAQCGDPFDSSTPYVEKDGYAWCVNCHTNRYSAKCTKCRKPITDIVVKALGVEWHGDCFCCVECGGPFDDGRYFLRSESQHPVCVGCEEKRLKA